MILQALAAEAAKRVRLAKQKVCPEAMRAAAKALPKGDFRFERALQGAGLSFICEIKRASPSRGILSESFAHREIARAYEAAGADCISCLTEPRWFLGSDQIFCEVRQDIALPMLRKDFTVDEYQLHEAKCMGADAVLLICALLDARTVARHLAICDDLGMSALVEAHDEAEIASAVSAGARLIGVNNRNLKDFTVDLSTAARLRDNVPKPALFVAESGVHAPSDIAALRAIGADAVLIGEALMRAADKRALLADFRRAAQ
ncbi:MAG: indole-3-glycerol phosphate synthase TrpC [Clostridiales bacterium]|nr:indole-3-glycerol phosphate synthase TrpC [Clostridiales bacterium]